MPAPWTVRASVEQAIRDCGGNLTKAAAALACSRQTLYAHIYRHGLERLAGVDLERRADVEKRELRMVQPRAPVEAPITATVKLPERLWKRARIQAIEEGVTVSEFVERALEKALA